MRNVLALSLVLASVYSCRGYPWPTDCRLAGKGRFALGPCQVPADQLDGINYTGETGNVRINYVDCTVPHLRFNWTADSGKDRHDRCFQPLYRCTWNSTELESELDIEQVKAGSEGRSGLLEDTSIHLTVGSECTFGGCYVNYSSFFDVYKIYWIEPVSCTINDNGCVKNPNACDSNADCSDVIGGFECTCRSGYTGNGTYCQDVDECSAGLHNCSDYANCSNTEGGFVCQCKTGFIGDGFNCTNVDECHTTNACDSNADCSDIIGGFECTCRSGYTGNGTYCQDVDECSAGLHNCSDYANCYNTEGGFVCQCKTGFIGDGFNCTNVDECHTNPCDTNADCSDIIGGFECTCQSGYTGNGTQCQDIDECSEGLDGCHQNAECIDTVGGYRCSCGTGFVGDGYSCEIGPLIGVLGIGFPALLLLAVCAVVMGICWMVVRNRQKAAELKYKEYFFPWKQPLKPGVEIVDAKRRVSFALSLESVFDSLTKPDKAAESAHSSSDGNTTDISFEDTQLLPNHKDRSVVSAGEELKTGHQLAARNRTSTVVQNGLIKTPANVQTDTQSAYCANSSPSTNHSGYILDSSATTCTSLRNSEYISTQHQGNYDHIFLAEELTGASEQVSQHQCDHIKGRRGYVSELMDVRELAFEIPDADQEDVVLSDLDAHSSPQVGSDTHDGRNPTSGLDRRTAQLSITPDSLDQPVRTGYVTVDESSFTPLQC